MTSFAVVVTSHNYREFVCEAVDSALAQTRAAARIIVVDDGSTDGSPELLRERYAANPRITLLFGDNDGQLAAFQRGLAHAGADVVCFLDADDRWKPDYLERIGSVYDSRKEVDFVFSDLLLFGRVGRGPETIRYRDRPSDQGYTVISTWALSHWCGAMTSALSLRLPMARRCVDVPDALRSCLRTGADECLVYGASLLGGRKYFLPTGSVEYRVHADNAWWPDTDPGRSYLDRIRARRVIAHFARVAGVDDSCIELSRLEYRTRPDANWNDTWRYIGLSLRRRAPWWNRLEDVLDIVICWVTGRR